MIAQQNGHSRPRVLCADVVDARLVQSDGIVASVTSPSLSVNFLTVATSTTFAGTAAFSGAVALPNPVAVSGAAVFANDVAVAAGHAVAVGPAPTLATTITVPAAQVLALNNVTLVGAAFSDGFVLQPGGTLTMTSATFTGLFTASGGLTIAPGQALFLGNLAGTPALAGGATLSGTLTFTGATLVGGGTGAMTGLFALNTFRANTVLGRRYGAPVSVPAGRVFPTFRPPANPMGVFVLDATSFSGQASNGTNTGGVRGAAFSTTGARATAVDNTDCVLQDFVCFNRSPYTFYLLNTTFQNMVEMSTVAALWPPLTTLRCSRAAFPTGATRLWKATAQPLRYVSGWASLSPALLTSADCTFDLYRHQYAVTVGGSNGGGVVGARLTGQLLIHFTTAAPTDPVRIAVPLPVGAAAETAYPAVSGFTPRCGVFRDWVVSATAMFPESATAFVGTGELARALGTYARTDATATVAAYIENGDPSANLVRVVVSGFTGGAGSYKLRCNYAVHLQNLVFRATYDTFTYVV